MQLELMMKLISGFVLGVVVSTVGFGGISSMLDRGVYMIQNFSQQTAQ